MGTVGERGFGGSVKFADGKTSSANVCGTLKCENAAICEKVAKCEKN